MVEIKEVIKVEEVIGGDTAVSTDDGQLIYDEISIAIKAKKVITVDFSGIQIMTTAFLNAAIGQLYSQFTSEVLTDFLKLVNVQEEDRILFKKVIERAKDYFKNKQSFGDAVNEGLDD